MSIHGDGNIGNVIGNNNRVVIDNRVTVKTQNSGGGGNQRSNNESDSSPLALGFAALVAIIVAAWKFALFAPVIYVLCKLGLLLMFVIGLTILGMLYNKQPRDWLINQGLLLLSLLIVGLAVWISAESYPMELTEIANNARDWKAFWCQLNNESGKPLSLYYMLSVCLLVIPTLILAVSASIGSVFRGLYEATGIMWFGRKALIQTTKLTYAILTLASLSLFAQTDFAKAELNVFLSKFNNNSFICTQ